MSTYGHIPTAWPCETLVYSEYLTLLMSDLIILFQRQIQWVLFTVLSILNSSLCLCWQSEHTHLSDPTRDRWREMKSRVSVSLCLLPGLSSATISTNQTQTIPRCSGQRPSQRAAEEEEKSGASQRQDSAPYCGEDTMICDINMHVGRYNIFLAVTYIKMILRNAFAFWHSFYTTEQGFPQVWLSTLSKENHTVQTRLPHSSPPCLHPSIISH